LNAFEAIRTDSKPADRARSSAAMQKIAGEILLIRKAAKSYLGGPALSEVAWNLMLVLFAFDENPRRLHIGSVAGHAGIPRSTALRWLTRLEQGGLVSITANEIDNRSMAVQLTPNGRTAMERSFVAARFPN
jgi:DNA-binding MarR family transcriptional regulator